MPKEQKNTIYLDSDTREAGLDLVEIFAFAGKLVCRRYEHAETLSKTTWLKKKGKKRT